MITFKTKSDQNIHQNAPNYTVLKHFLGEACSEPHSKAHRATGKFINLKKNLAPPAKSWLRPVV